MTLMSYNRSWHLTERQRSADCVFVYSRKRRVLVQQLEQTRHRVPSSKSPLEKEFDIGESLVRRGESRKKWIAKIESNVISEFEYAFISLDHITLTVTNFRLAWLVHYLLIEPAVSN